MHTARDAGAYGAKITGAGGGGCIVALVRGSGADAVASAINDAGGRARTGLLCGKLSDRPKSAKWSRTATLRVL